MPDASPRSVRLVLVTPAGDVLGRTGEFAVSTPWWPEAWPVVRAARERFGVDVVVLRMLEAVSPVTSGGLVTYQAEVRSGSPVPDGLDPWTTPLDDHPLRAPWARPGGPDADLAWADEALRRQGLEPTAPPEQIRTWNLSSLWKLPVRGQTAWLKHVPPFFAHEGAILARLAGGPVPSLLGHDGARILMPELPGEDLYDVGRPTLDRLVTILVNLQRDWVGRTDELLGMGLPDWRAEELTAKIADALERTAPEMSADDVAVLEGFVRDLPARFRQLADAGIPDTLVHGDFHPGNARGDGTTLVLLDWGDSGVGNPLLDQAAYLDRVPADAVEPIRELWTRAWQEAVPGSDPAAAARILAPVAAGRQAVIYRMFLDGIEPSEWQYHAGDPADWLGRAAAFVRSEGSSR